MSAIGFEPLYDGEKVLALLREQCAPHAQWIAGIRELEVLHARLRSYARPERARDAWLRVCYAARLEGEDVRADEPVLLHGTAVHGRAQAGKSPLRVAGEDFELRLHRFPDDPSLPQLAALVDPAAALRRMPRRARAQLASAARAVAAPARCRVVSYRPAERCMLAYEVGGCRVLYAKSFASGIAGVQQRRLLALRAALRGRSVIGALEIPEPLGLSDAAHTLWLAAVAGTSAADLLVGAERVATITRLCAALAELHALPPGAAPLADRVQRLLETVRKLRKLENEFPDAVRPVAPMILNRCEELLVRAPATAGELRHGDVHPGQFHLTRQGVALFDLDELARGDLEEDLAALAVAIGEPGRSFAAYRDAAAAPRGPDPGLYELHYRLQLVDRAYRDYWRQGPAKAAAAVRRSLEAAAGNVPEGFPR